MRVTPTATPDKNNTFSYFSCPGSVASGKIAASTGFGRVRFGASKIGDRRRVTGIFQKRKLSKDRTRYNPDTNPEHPVIVMRTYRPTYANTEIQQEQRQCFAAAVSFWQGLTDEEKAIYNRAGAKHNTSGYNIAISDFIRRYNTA